MISTSLILIGSNQIAIEMPPNSDPDSQALLQTRPAPFCANNDAVEPNPDPQVLSSTRIICAAPLPGRTLPTSWSVDGLHASIASTNSPVWGHFDVVLVDGRCRIGSALKSLCYMKDNSMLLVHDWPRNYAEAMLKHFELRRVLQTLAVLSPMPHCTSIEAHTSALSKRGLTLPLLEYFSPFRCFCLFGE